MNDLKVLRWTGAFGVAARVAGVTTSAGWYAYVSDVMGIAYIGWLLIVGISMMRVKREAVAPTLRERELKEVR